MKFLISFLFVVTACAHVGPTPGPARDAKQDIHSLWLEYGPGGRLIARTIVIGQGQCPLVSSDGEQWTMKLRASPTPDGRFANSVCEAVVSSSAQSLSIGGRALPKITLSPRRILVFGDTGCRIKKSSNGKMQVQDCNNPKNGWPLAALAEAAAQKKPDLIIHVGDYHYREAACPAGNSKCANSPYGDTWDSWSSDFFTPVQPLMNAAPWIFVRGNHESCSRAQEGFFRYLDPREIPATCPDTTLPYLVHLPNLDLAVMDSADKDPTADWLNSINSLQMQNAWLLSHRPLWISAEEAAQGDDDSPDNSVQSKPVGAPKNVALVLGGHRHLFRAFGFADKRPPQITVGNGGTLLDSNSPADPVGTAADANSTTLASVTTMNSFGFVILERQHHLNWLMHVYDKRGKQVGTCQINSIPAHGAVTCQLTKSRKRH